jgi:vacuolar-type H+-ATPase subunit E/Vma4
MSRNPKANMEARMAALEKRQDECEMWRSQTDAFVKAMTEWRESIDRSNNLQQQMIDKAEQVVHAVDGLVWLGNGVKWVAGVVIAVIGALAAWRGYFQ